MITILESKDSRAALITPNGVGGIAVVRLCGGRWSEVLDEIFSPIGSCGALTQSSKPFESNDLRFGKISDGPEVIDQVIVAVDHDGGGVEINCHGGPRVVQRLLMLLGRQGVKVVSWEELLGGDSIAQEVALVLPKVKTQMATLAIAGQYPGGLFAWGRGVVDSIEGGATDDMLADIHRDIDGLLLTYPLAEKMITPPTVVLAGPVNAGKSTLANAISGRALSVASDLPGTTRDWTGQLVEINGLAINLIDTAGRRDSSDALEQRSVVRTDAMICQADLVVLVVEANGEEVRQIAEQMDTFPDGIEPIIVANKSDKYEASSQFISVSGLERLNLDSLYQEIVGKLGFGEGFAGGGRLVFTGRQYSILQKAKDVEVLEELLPWMTTLCGDGRVG